MYEGQLLYFEVAVQTAGCYVVVTKKNLLTRPNSYQLWFESQ